MTATPVADAIRAMQDRLGRPEWWGKHAYELGETRCLSGALGLVTDEMGVPFFWAVRNLLMDVLTGWTNAEYLMLRELNDDPTTTHDDILLFLDAALDVAEAEGL